MNEKSTFWTNLFILAGGIVLICMHDRVNLLSWAVFILGVLFAVPGLIGIIVALRSSARNTSVDTVNTASAAGSLLIGLIMVFWPSPFVAVFVYFLATVLILFGLMQIWILSIGGRGMGLPGWLFVLPVCVIITGVVLICTPIKETQTAFTLVAGIAMVCDAVNGLLIYQSASESRHADRKYLNGTIDTIDDNR